MKIQFSDEFVRSARRAVLKAAAAGGVIDIHNLCHRIQAQNPLENVALEDIEVLVLKLIQERQAPIFLAARSSRPEMLEIAEKAEAPSMA